MSIGHDRRIKTGTKSGDTKITKGTKKSWGEDRSHRLERRQAEGHEAGEGHEGSALRASLCDSPEALHDTNQL
jgi:hypothetical protein